MAANGLNVVAVRIEDKWPIVVRMIVGPKPWLVVVAPARADSRCVKAVDGSAIRNRKSHVDTSNGRRFRQSRTMYGRCSTGSVSSARLASRPMLLGGSMTTAFSSSFAKAAYPMRIKLAAMLCSGDARSLSPRSLILKHGLPTQCSIWRTSVAGQPALPEAVRSSCRVGRAGDWDAIAAYEVKGKNTYAQQVAAYRDRLLAAHRAKP